jgi:hypothetical protein
MSIRVLSDAMFHGTVHKFSKGDRVGPAGDNKYHKIGSGDHAHATKDPEAAWNYAELAHDWNTHRQESGPFPIPRVYRVSPIGGFESDPTVSANSTDVRSEQGFRVEGEEEPPEDFDPEDWRH